jgi:phosphatidylglycerophosphatase C
VSDNRPVWAAFDFDGTLTRRDSLLPFLRFALGPTRLLTCLAAESPALARYALGLMANDRAKEKLLTRCLGGDAAARIAECGRRFARERLPRLLHVETMALMEAHRRAGHVCVLVSASPGYYLRPWAADAGFDQVICTELEVDAAGKLTGRLDGGNCYGEEKARRLKAILPANVELHAYGDSPGDRPMLALAAHGWYRGQRLRR